MNTVRTAAVVTLLFAIGCTPRNDANTLRPKQRAAIDSLVDAEIANGVPGIAVAVVRRGQTTYVATRGLARVEAKLPVTAETPFQLASTTKVFSATALLTLVREGRLKLDDRIGDLLPDLPPTWRPVTIRQLLSHTSGVPDIVRVTGTNTLVAETWDDAFSIVSRRSNEFAAGTRWSYNQTNYALIKRLVERLSHRSFDAFMHERLFEPTRMLNAFYTTPSDTATRCARNYQRGADGQPSARALYFLEFMHAAAGMCASLHDLIQWTGALDSGRVLPSDLAKAMWTAAPLDSGRVASYGLGWVVDATDGHRFVGHSGGNATAYRRYLDDSLSVIVLSNGMLDPDRLVTTIATLVLSDVDQVQLSAEERLWDAARSGDVKGVVDALDAGADVNALDVRVSKSGRRSLNWAALGDHAEVIAALLKRGAGVDLANGTGFTALHHAAESGSRAALTVLLAAGASRSVTTKDGERPSDTARRKGHEDIAALIDAKR